MLKNVVFFVKSLKRLARNNNSTATFANFFGLISVIFTVISG